MTNVAILNCHFYKVNIFTNNIRISVSVILKLSPPRTSKSIRNKDSFTLRSGTAQVCAEYLSLREDPSF